MRKTLAALLVLIVITAILFLTCQGPKETSDLSNTVRVWLQKHGIVLTSVQLRHYAHYPMYFLLGVALWLWFGDWRALLGIAVGLLDEMLKIVLPTREFDWTDFCRDAVAVLVAVLICWGVKKAATYETARNMM